MPLYFMLHDGDRFHQLLHPALAASWCRRSFEPCRPLLAALRPDIDAFTERYRIGRDEPLLGCLDRGLPFDRATWRLLVGEVLLYGAAEIPEFQTAPDTLCALLAPDSCDNVASRRDWPPIRQAHFGARDLVFGGYYRPEHAGCNDGPDVARLADYLSSCDPDRWTATQLRAVGAAAGDELGEELAFGRQCLVTLRDMYTRAAANGQLVACEVL